jgi:hypothetical protein
MKTKILLLAFLSLTIISCDKEEEEKALSEKAQLLIGSWKKTKIESKKPNQNWENITRDCDVDDIEEFKNNGKYTLYPGSSLCEGQSNVISSGTWKFGANESVIIFTYDGYEGEYESVIESLSSTSLVVKFATGLTDGSERRTTYVKTN